MKTKIIITTIALGLMSVAAVNAQTTAKAEKGVKTETFKVYGNCGMCKARIEKAANGVKGVKSAEWNTETKMMSVTFDERKNSLDVVINAIAAVGHDTKWNSANDKAYGNLPGCCKYDRKGSEGGKKEMKGHEGHNH